MTTLVKVLLGSSAVILPSSAITMFAFRDSLFSRLSTEITMLKEKCFVIPTANVESEAKLLICKGEDELSSGYDSYFLYNKNDNKKIKVVAIYKKEEALELTLEGESRKVTLSMVQDDWTEVAGETNLKEACNLMIYPEESNGGTKWHCNWGDSNTKEVKLAKFEE